MVGNAQAEGNYWHLKRIMRRLVVKYHDTILMERYIWKDGLYRVMSWWFRQSRNETKELLRMLPKAYPGVRFTNRGLFIPKSYIDPRQGVIAWPTGTAAEKETPKSRADNLP